MKGSNKAAGESSIEEFFDNHSDNAMLLSWAAAQGNRIAQRKYAEMLRKEGLKDWADFYEAKAKGQSPHFTLGSFLSSKKVSAII